MAEEQVKNKKPGIYKRILKWIGLGLLVLLLIASLIFRAPWKVISSLLIILAACTVLPRPYRKWLWLSVATIVLVLIIWVFLPEDSEGWRPYTFDEELAALEAKYAIPDSENAAKIYNALLEEFDPNTIHPDFLDPNIKNFTLREFWSSKDNPELDQWLEGHQNTIAKLCEASKVEKCAFPITHDILSMCDSTVYLPQIRGWAYLLVRAGNNDMAEGRIEEGLEKYLSVKNIGDHMRQQSTLLEMLVGIAVEALAIGRFKAFVVTADATEEHLSLIEKAVADIKYDWSSDLPRILECEKLMTKNTFCSLAYEINQEGKVRFTRDPTAVARERFPEEMPPPTYWQRNIWKAGVILAYLGMPSSPKKVSKNMDSGFQRLYAMAEPDFDWGGSPKEFSINPMKVKFNWIYLTRTIADMMASMLEESYYSVHDQYLRNIAEQRGARVIFALRRYKNKTGHWPETLDDIKDLIPDEILVDSINGGSFVYRLTEENFTLYSKGKNNIDEGGERDKESGADDWLIWPPRTRKSKKEKANAE